MSSCPRRWCPSPPHHCARAIGLFDSPANRLANSATSSRAVFAPQSSPLREVTLTFPHGIGDMRDADHGYGLGLRKGQQDCGFLKDDVNTLDAMADYAQRG